MKYLCHLVILTAQYVMHNHEKHILILQSNLSSRTPWIMKNSVYEQIFRTQSVSDDVLCLELRTRKPSKRRQKQITLDNFLVRHWPCGSEAESSGAKRQKKEKESPSKQQHFTSSPPSTYAVNSSPYRYGKTKLSFCLYLIC